MTLYAALRRWAEERNETVHQLVGGGERLKKATKQQRRRWQRAEEPDQANRQLVRGAKVLLDLAALEAAERLKAARHSGAR